MPSGSRASPGSDLAKGEGGRGFAGLARQGRRRDFVWELSRLAMRRVLCMV
jgi:hypothetical protein